MRAVFVSLIALLGLLTTPAWAQDIVITITPTAQQLEVFAILINQECQRLIAGGDPPPGFCSVTNNVCTCTPNDNQKAAAVKKLYIDDQFQADRAALYRDHAEELARRYRSASKANRDTCDNALGLIPLP